MRGADRQAETYCSNSKSATEGGGKPAIFSYRGSASLYLPGTIRPYKVVTGYNDAPIRRHHYHQNRIWHQNGTSRLTTGSEVYIKKGCACCTCYWKPESYEYTEAHNIFSACFYSKEGFSSSLVHSQHPHYREEGACTYCTGLDTQLVHANDMFLTSSPKRPT